MPRYLTEDDVVATLTMRDALELLDAAAKKQASGAAMNAPRQRVHSGAAMLQVLPAALDGRVAHKSYTIGPRGATFWVTLYSPGGEMLAIISANRLGQIRTGAASGLATRYLARPDVSVLATIGTGFQARTQIEAICLARPIERVLVWGRDPQRLATFTAEMTALLDRRVEAAAGADAAVREADVVATMTSSAQPVFAGRELRPGTHVNAAGSNRLTAQEIDVETVRRAELIVVEDVAQARTESGDLRSAIDAGHFAWDSAIRLADIVSGTHPGRSTPEQITLFESLGIGLWDIAVASHIYDACIREGRGVDLPFPG